MSHKVEAWGEEVEVAVYQKSISVWIAIGTYKSETVKVKRSTRGAALLGWKDASRYRGN
jgi:hypothetical protein